MPTKAYYQKHSVNLCACGCQTRVFARWAKGHYQRSPQHQERVGRLRQGMINSLLAPSMSPDMKTIAWAAGIYEGEGSVSLGCRKLSDGRRRYGGAIVSVAQLDPELLYRLKTYFGGSVQTKHHGYSHRWNLTGTRGRGFLMTIYPFLTQRRRGQIRKIFGGVNGASD